VSNLQNFLLVYYVVAGIVYYYDELASPWPIPRVYLNKCSLAQLAESVALEFHALSSTITPATFSSTVDGSDAVVQGGQSGSNGRGGQDGQRVGQDGQRVGQDGGRGGQEGDQGGGQGGQEGGRGGRGGRVGWGGRGDCGREGEDVPLSPEGPLFRDVILTIIPMDTFTTPKKNSRHQKSTI